MKAFLKLIAGVVVIALLAASAAEAQTRKKSKKKRAAAPVAVSTANSSLPSCFGSIFILEEGGTVLCRHPNGRTCTILEGSREIGRAHV